MAGEYLTDEELLATSKSSASRAKASNEYLTDEELLASGNDDNWDAAIAAQAEHAKRTRGIGETINDTVIETANSAAGMVGAIGDFIVPGNRVSEGIDSFIKEGEKHQSDVVRADKEKFQIALKKSETIGDDLSAVADYIMSSPLQATAQAIGSFGPTGLGMKAAKVGTGLLGGSEKAATIASRTTGIGMGVAGGGGDAAGDAYKLVQSTPDEVLMKHPVVIDLVAKGVPFDQIKDDIATRAARKASILPGIAGGVAGYFGAEKLLAGGAIKDGYKHIVGTGLVDGGTEAIEEGIAKYTGQSAAQQYNPAINPWKNVTASAAMGGVLGLGTGASIAAITPTIPDAKNVDELISATKSSIDVELDNQTNQDLLNEISASNNATSSNTPVDQGYVPQPDTEPRPTINIAPDVQPLIDNAEQLVSGQAQPIIEQSQPIDLNVEPAQVEQEFQPTEGQNVQDIIPETQSQPIELTPETGSPVGIAQEQVIDRNQPTVNSDLASTPMSTIPPNIQQQTDQAPIDQFINNNRDGFVKIKGSSDLYVQSKDGLSMWPVHKDDQKNGVLTKPKDDVLRQIYSKFVNIQATTLPTTPTTQQQNPSTPLPASAPKEDVQTSQPVDDTLKTFRTEILKYKGEGKTVTGTKTIYDATDRLKAIAEDTSETSLKAQQVWFNSKRKTLEKNGDAEAAALFERIVAQLKERINTAQGPAPVKIDDQVATVASDVAGEADEVVGDKEPTAFKTAKGSSYIVHEDGTTTRTKAARSDVGHEGDSGLKDRSERTVYISREATNQLAIPADVKWRIVEHKNGTLSLATKNQDGKWGITASAKNIDFETKPNIGSFPLELWNTDTLNGLPSYSAAHFGNAIVAQETKPQLDQEPLGLHYTVEFDAAKLGLNPQDYKSQNELSIAIAETEQNLTAQGKEALEELLLEDQFDEIFGDKLTEKEINSWLSLLDNNEENDNSTTQGTTESGVTESNQSGEQDRDAEAQGKEGVDVAGKEPWQMTQKEFAESLGKELNGELREKHVDAIKKAHAEGMIIPNDVLKSYPILRDKFAPPVKSSADERPSTGKYTQPQNVSSRDDQIALANRASRIANLKLMNDKVGAYSDHEIQNTADDKIDAVQQYLINEFNKQLDQEAKPDPISQMAASVESLAKSVQTLVDNQNDVSKKAENVDTSKERIKGIDISAEGVRDEPAAIEDFGQKIEGAKKDMAAAVSKEYGDDDLVTLPLSKIWPANLSDKIEDNFVAAFAYAARAELPSKPRKPYAVKVWIGKVKALREMVSMVLSSDSMRTKAESLLNETKALEGFNAKVKLLESLDREQWGRIGNVREYPGAYRYEGENQVPSPYVAVSIDDRTQIFAGETSVSNVVDKVNEKLGIEKQAARMKFEVRGRGEAYFINKAGDSEYRKLKTFKTAKEALDYRNDHYDDLVAAWEDVKDRDNVKKDDVRGEENRPRTAEDWRKGKDVTVEQFSEAFGFRGGQFGNWVSQGNNAKERQWMLNNAYDAFMDLASILNIPPKAVSLDGQLGISFGARGRGKASAHFESDAQVINLTKTRGAGVLAHEWFHALDNYFQRSRNAPMGNNRESRYVTYRPEPFYVHKGRNTSVPLSKAELKRRHEIDPGSPRYNMQFWEVDKNHPQGIRPEVEERFAALVESLNDSPMTQRALVIDKGKEDGYWSRIIERAARSFENYVIAKMSAKGFNNDYLANVVNIADFKRDEGRYPYLKEEELAPVVEAFDNLFGEIKSKETDKGTALFSKSTPAKNTHTVASATSSMLEAHTGKIKSVLQAMLDNGKAKVVTAEQAAGIVGEGALYMTAWHGSPHDHDGFSMDKVGTGEGAQAYGHGLYFAGNKEVAEHYKKQLSIDSVADGAMEESNNNKELAISNLRKYLKNEQDSFDSSGNIYNKKSIDAINKAIKYLQNGSTGKLYQVELAPNEADYLLWDKPLSEQSEKVKAAFNNVGNELRFGKDKETVADYLKIVGQLPPQIGKENGHAIYSEFAKQLGGAKAASAYLHSLGIRGIKYLDGSSRSAGDGNFNYVIFNDQDVKITAKFAKDGQALAFYNPHDGITYFIADHIPEGYTAKEWEGLVLHEIATHALQLGRNTKEFKSILNQIDLMRKAGNKAVVAAFKRVPKDTRPENVTEEAIAYLLQESPQLGIVQRVLSWFRNAIRAIGKSFPTLQKMRLNDWANNLNESDLRFMAESALKNAEPSGVQNESDTPQFSKSSQTDTPAFKKWFGESKVVDAEGKPMVVYHGTGQEGLTEFYGGWWTEDKRVTREFGNQRYEAYLSLKNPAYDDDLLAEYNTMIGEDLTLEEIENDRFESLKDAATSGGPFTRWLKEKGYDGIAVFDESNGGPSAMAYVAFSPNQVKSALGNNGNFDGSSNNILFSKNTNPVTHPFQPENSGKPLDSWIKIFTRNQIVTLYRDSLIGKKLEEYKELRERVTADTNSLFEKADNFLLELRQIPKGLRDAFASLAHDSTLNNVDPSNPKYVPSPDAVKLASYLTNPTNQNLAAKIKKRLNSMEAAHKKLHAEFSALPAKEQELFKELRSKYTEQMTMVFDEFKNRIGRMKSIDPAIKARSIKKLNEQLSDLLGRVYFPLYRAGNYIVKAEKAGEPTTVDHVESNFAADRLEKKLKKLGYTVSRSTRIVSPQDNKSGEALNAVRDLLDKAALKGKIEGAALSQLMDDIDQTILQSLPDQSYRKSFIHRKGTKGYSDDFIRAYADAMRRGSINIANLRHGDKITTVIEDMRKDVKAASKVPGSNVEALNQVVDRVEQIEVDIRNPTSKLVSVSGKIAFAQMLGSLSNFILNLTQIPLLTMPHLGAEYGYGKANLQLAMAFAKQMRSLKKQGTLSELGKWLDMRHGLVGNELDLMQQLHDSGFLDLTQSFDLIDAANNPSYQENELSMNFMKVIALPQHVSEIVNRQVTALATIRLEMARSGSPLKAYRAAIKAIDETHFNYSKENRSKLMTGNTQSMLFKFKQYPQQAAFLFVHTAKLALNGSTKLDSDGNKLDGTRPSERTKARKQLAGMLGMQILVAGTLGLPVFAEAAVAASGVAGFKLAGSTGAYVGVAGAMIIAAALAFGDDDGEEFDVEVKKWFIQHFGKDIGSSLADGIIPRGLASRLNASELVIRRPKEARNSTDFANQWMISLLGAFWGGTVYNAGVGLKDIVEGDTAKGATKLIPVKAIKDLVTSWKWANDGMNVTNKDGEIITPVSKADIFFKSIGINPTSVVNAREYDNAKFTLHNALLKKQQKALKELREETDKTKRFNAIIKYNKSAPLGYEIDSDKVRGVIAREIKYKGKPNVVTGNPVQEDYLNKNTRELRPAY